MEEDNNNPIKSYGSIKLKRKNTNSMTLATIFVWICAVVCVSICVLLLYGIYSGYLVYDTTEDASLYKAVNEINFRDCAQVPTLYKYTGYSNIIDSVYRYEDDRFGEYVTTIEFDFERIPEDYIETYKNALVNVEGYTLSADWEGDDVYTQEVIGLNPHSGKYEKMNAFVIIGDTRVMYGVLLGDYQRIFK